MFQRNDSCFAHVMNSTDSTAIVVFMNDSSTIISLYSSPNTEKEIPLEKSQKAKMLLLQKKQKAKERMILERQKLN